MVKTSFMKLNNQNHMDFIYLFFIVFHLRKTLKKVLIIIFSIVEKIKYVFSTVIHNNHSISYSLVPS